VSGQGTVTVTRSGSDLASIAPRVPAGRAPSPDWIDIELFAGAGGLAVGLSDAGFGPANLYEVDENSCATLRLNTSGRNATISHGTVFEADVAELKWSDITSPVRLLAAGTPCQPFSLAGKHGAYDDGRNMFPHVFRAVRSLRPAAVFLENVRGLLRPNFLPYFDYILAQLECPSIAPRKDELWRDHFARIKRHRCSPGVAPEYNVVWRLVDAADFGVPQNRHRVFIVATRAGLPSFAFPQATHSKHALIHSQDSGEYWEMRGLPRQRLVYSNGTMPLDLEDKRLPWRTVRDALAGLPAPAKAPSETTINHWLIPGARAYAGHSGSALDWPSKTIKAGVHGVPGGENTVVDGKGTIRYYTLREAARIQSFPDSHVFSGSRAHVTRQIGNAVPPTLSAVLARPLYELLQDTNKSASRR